MNTSFADPHEASWSPEKLAVLNKAFENASPRTILSWAYQTFGSGVVMATGFGTSGLVLMHIAIQLRDQPSVFYLDTDLFFPETYALRDTLAYKWGIHFTRVSTNLTPEKQAERYGDELWKHQSDACCFLRKVLPLRAFLADKKAWITGVRTQQSSTRTHTRMIEWDAANGLIKINPLAYWTTKDTWDYVRMHDLPYNTLHDKGYPSIGCMPCTRPIEKNGSERSGRWAGSAKTECGIHVQSLTQPDFVQQNGANP